LTAAAGAVVGAAAAAAVGLAAAAGAAVGAVVAAAAGAAVGLAAGAAGAVVGCAAAGGAVVGAAAGGCEHAWIKGRAKVPAPRATKRIRNLRRVATWRKCSMVRTIPRLTAASPYAAQSIEWLV